MRRTTFLLGAAMFVITACTTKAPDAETKSADVAATTPDAATDDANLKAEAAKWWDLYNKGDAQGVADLYTDDGIVLAAGSPAAVGREAIHAFLVKDIAATRGAGLTMKGGDLNGSGISGDLAWVSGSFQVVDGSGKSVMDGKYTSLFRRVDSGWKLIRDTWNADAEAPPPAPPKA
jgi:uncharacterized protein (TIGR02246 family)